MGIFEMSIFKMSIFEMSIFKMSIFKMSIFEMRTFKKSSAAVAVAVGAVVFVVVARALPKAPITIRTPREPRPTRILLLQDFGPPSGGTHKYMGWTHVHIVIDSAYAHSHDSLFCFFISFIETFICHNVRTLTVHA